MLSFYTGVTPSVHVKKTNSKKDENLKTEIKKFLSDKNLIKLSQISGKWEISDSNSPGSYDRVLSAIKEGFVDIGDDLANAVLGEIFSTTYEPDLFTLPHQEANVDPRDVSSSPELDRSGTPETDLPPPTSQEVNVDPRDVSSSEQLNIFRVIENNHTVCYKSSDPENRYKKLYDDAYDYAKKIRNSEDFTKSYQHNFDMKRLDDTELDTWSQNFAKAVAYARYNSKSFVSKALSYALCIANKKSEAWTSKYVDAFLKDDYKDKPISWKNIYAGFVADGKPEDWACKYADTHITQKNSLEYTNEFMTAKDRGYPHELAKQYATHILEFRNQGRSQRCINYLTIAYDNFFANNKSSTSKIDPHWVSDFANAFAFRKAMGKNVEFLTKAYEIAKNGNKSTAWANNFADNYANAIINFNSKSEIWLTAYVTCLTNKKEEEWAAKFADAYVENLTTNRSRDPLWKTAGATNIDEGWAETYATFIADGNDRNEAIILTDIYEYYMTRNEADESKAEEYAYAYLNNFRQTQNNDQAHEYALRALTIEKEKSLVTYVKNNWLKTYNTFIHEKNNLKDAKIWTDSYLYYMTQSGFNESKAKKYASAFLEHYNQNEPNHNQAHVNALKLAEKSCNIM